MAPDDAVGALDRFELFVVPIDREAAIQIGLLRSLPQDLGLGLADRACLALANRLGRPALTTDRSWARIPRELLNVEVELIR